MDEKGFGLEYATSTLGDEGNLNGKDCQEMGKKERQNTWNWQSEVVRTALQRQNKRPAAFFYKIDFS